MKNKIMENKMNTLIAALLACIMLFSSAASIPVHASGAGWFIGGVAASRIEHNMRERTQAEEQQAYYAQQQSSISLSSAWRQLHKACHPRRESSNWINWLRVATSRRQNTSLKKRPL